MWGENWSGCGFPPTFIRMHSCSLLKGEKNWWTVLLSRMWKKRVKHLVLMLVKIINCVLYGADGVTQVSVMNSTISGLDPGRLHADKSLNPLFRFRLIFNSVVHYHWIKNVKNAKILITIIVILYIILLTSCVSCDKIIVCIWYNRYCNLYLQVKRRIEYLSLSFKNLQDWQRYDSWGCQYAGTGCFQWRRAGFFQRRQTGLSAWRNNQRWRFSSKIPRYGRRIAGYHRQHRAADIGSDR